MARKKYDEDVKTYTRAQLTKYKKLAKDHYIENNGEVSVKVLARKAKVPQGYIRKWMKEEDWDKDLCSPEEQITLNPKTKKVLKSGANEYGLNEQEEAFCYHYLKTLNATTSAIRAGYSSSYAHNKAYLLLKEDKINNFLTYVRSQRNEELFIDSIRIIQEYMKIAFADITDFLKFGPHGVTLKPSDMVDGQLITKVKEGKEGVSIELANKMEALSKLEKYLDVMPKDWKQAIEEKKLDILTQKLELEKQKYGQGEEGDDDGFIAALADSVKEVWSDEET